jgi:hypothetical protein
MSHLRTSSYTSTSTTSSACSAAIETELKPWRYTQVPERDESKASVEVVGGQEAGAVGGAGEVWSKQEKLKLKGQGERREREKKAEKVWMEVWS